MEAKTSLPSWRSALLIEWGIMYQLILWMRKFSFPSGSLNTPGFPGGAVVKNWPASAGNSRDVGSIPGSGRSPGEGNGSPLLYSCLQNSMDRRAWQTTVHGVTKSQTRLSDWEHTHILILTIKWINQKGNETRQENWEARWFKFKYSINKINGLNSLVRRQSLTLNFFNQVRWYFEDSDDLWEGWEYSWGDTEGALRTKMF